MILELERAEGVGDALDCVRLAVGEVVQRIDAPLVAGPRVGCVQDPVEHRVAHVDVGRGHVDLCPEHFGAVRKLPRAHALEQVEVLIDRTVAPGAVLARLCEGAAVLPDLVGGEVVDVGLAGLDQVYGPVVELVEVVGGEVEMLAPVEAEPADVFLDRVDVLLLFLDRVGVVEAQVAAAAELLGDPEVERDRLGVAEVEVSVRLGREARHDLRNPALAHVGGDDLADEIAPFGRGRSAGAHAAVARHLDQRSAVHRHVWRSRCTHAQVTTTPHTRKPPASSGRRAASHALMNSSDLASLRLQSSLTTPRHLAGEDKAPAPRGRDGTSAQALLASTGNIWPTRNTQREANYAQLARHAGMHVGCQKSAWPVSCCYDQVDCAA